MSIATHIASPRYQFEQTYHSLASAALLVDPQLRAYRLNKLNQRLRDLIEQAHADALVENAAPMWREITAEREQLTAAELAYAAARIARLG